MTVHTIHSFSILYTLQKPTDRHTQTWSSHSLFWDRSRLFILPDIIKPSSQLVGFRDVWVNSQLSRKLRSEGSSTKVRHLATLHGYHRVVGPIKSLGFCSPQCTHDNSPRSINKLKVTFGGLKSREELSNFACMTPQKQLYLPAWPGYDGCNIPSVLTHPDNICRQLENFTILTNSMLPTYLKAFRIGCFIQHMVASFQGSQPRYKPGNQRWAGAWEWGWETQQYSRI